MGNKESKAISDSLAQYMREAKKNGISISAEALSDDRLVTSLAKEITGLMRMPDMKRVHDEVILNVPKEMTMEERLEEGTKMGLEYVQSLVLGGHLEQPEVKEMFESACPDKMAVKFPQHARGYAEEMASRFVCWLFFFAETKDKVGEVSFREKLKEFVKRQSNTFVEDPQGTSTALFLSVTSFDPSKLLHDSEVSERVREFFSLVKPLSFHDQSFQSMVLNRAIQHLRNALLKVLMYSLERKEECKHLDNAITTLGEIGFARGSIEDLLLVVQLMVQYQPHVSLEGTLRKFMQLPDVLSKVKGKILDFEPTGLSNIVHFGNVYFDGDMRSSGDVFPSSACDGEFLYFYNTKQGLMRLECREGRVLGKPHGRNAEAKRHGRLQLFCAGSELYCHLEDGKFGIVDKDKLEISECPAFEGLSVESNSLLSSFKDSLVVFKSETGPRVRSGSSSDSENEHRDEGAMATHKAKVSIYDLKSKTMVSSSEIILKVRDAQTILACGKMLVVLGMGDLEVYNMLQQISVDRRSVNFREAKTLCTNPVTNEIYFLIKGPGGFVAANVDSSGLFQETSKALDARLSQVREAMKGVKEGEEARREGEMAKMLGMYLAGAEEEGRCKTEFDPLQVTQLLALQASRTSDSAGVVNAADMQDPSQVVGLFNIPMGVNLSAESLLLQLDLIETLFARMKEGKVEEEITFACECLSYLLLILNVHMTAMKKCGLTMEACAGPAGKAKLEHFAKCIVNPICDIDLLNNFRIANAEVAGALRKECLQFLTSNQLFSAVEGGANIAALKSELVRYGSEKSGSGDLDELLLWLSRRESPESIAKALMAGDEECLELLNAFLKLETEYIKMKLEAFMRAAGERSDTAYPKLQHGFDLVLNHLIRAVGQKAIQDPETETKRVLIVILSMLHPHIKQILAAVRSSYSEMKQMSEKKPLEDQTAEYVKYWQFIQTLLCDSVISFRVLSLYPQALIGLKLNSEQFIRLSENISKLIEEFKPLLSDLSQEKRQENGLIKQLIKHLRTPEGKVTGDLSMEENYVFPGASEVRISLDQDLDVPRGEDTSFEMNVGNDQRTDLSSLLFRGMKSAIRSSSMQIRLNFTSGSMPCEGSYTGFDYIIKPKFKYGQHFLKQILRSLVWSVSRMARQVLAQFEDGAAEAKLANEDQELMKSIMRSMILSGGIPTREFPSLFSPSFQHQFAALKERLGGVEEQEHADADAARHDELINAILSGKSEAVEGMIKQLIASSTKLRPTARISDERSKRLVRAMFALMVKMTGASNHCLTIMEQSNEGSYEKVLKLWGQALKIKRGFTDKKSDLPSSLSEAEWEAALDKLESSMMEKIQLLLKFKPIAVIEQEKLQSKRKLLFSDRMRRAFAASKASPAEQLKQKLQSWKSLQTVQKKEESYEGNVESSIMLIIESDITRAQLLSAIETHYIRGILIFHSLILFERGLRNLHSKAIRHDLLSWFLATFRMSETSNVKHYSELTTSCGVEFQQVLRTAFFGVIKQVLKYITASSEVMEVSYLLTALNWHYSASDHLHILDSGILQSLKKSDTFVSTLWGRLVGKYKISSYALLRTFEFIVTKVVSRLAKQQEEPGSGREDAQRLTKSVSLIDERNAMTLVHEIWRMIFDEIRSAAESFESTPGIDPVVLQEFSQMMKKQSEKEIKPREMSAIRASSMKCAKRFQEAVSGVYSTQFCSSTLQLLYHFLLVVQDNRQLLMKVTLGTKEEELVSLFRILEYGSLHHCFLVLSIIPLMAKLSLKSLEDAVEIFTKQKGEFAPAYTRHPLLDYLLHYAYRKREGMWFTQVFASKGDYAASKFAIRAIRLLAENYKEYEERLVQIAQMVLFGTEEELEKGPSLWRNIRFADLVLAVVGGEQQGVVKGGVGHVKGMKGYQLLAFSNCLATELEYQWDFDFQKHNEAQVHVSSDFAGGLKSEKPIKVPLAEFVPSNNLKPLNVLQGVSIDKAVAVLSSLLLSPPANASLILETVRAKALRLMLYLVKRNPELAKSLQTTDVVLKLLEKSVKAPRIGLNRSLVTAQILVEEMRKSACEAENVALDSLDAPLSRSTIRVEKNSLVVTLSRGSIVFPILAHKASHGLSDIELCLYSSDLKPEQVESRALFVSSHNLPAAQSAKLLDNAKAVITDTPLENLLDHKTPMIEISSAHMSRVESSLKELESINTYLKSTKMEKVVEEFLNVKEGRAEDSEHYRRIMKTISKAGVSLSEDEQSHKQKEDEEEIIEEIQDIAPSRLQASRLGKTFGTGFDRSFQSSKEHTQKEHAKGYSKLFEVLKNVTPESYASAVSDLKLFYYRRILCVLLRSEPHIPTTSFNQLIKFLRILSLETKYLSSGFSDTRLTKKLERLLEQSLGSLTEHLFPLIQSAASCKPTKGPPTTATTERELMKGINMEFIHQFLTISLRSRRQQVIRHPQIGKIIAYLLAIVAAQNPESDKYWSLCMVDEIMKSAVDAKKELPVENCNAILTSKGLCNLSQALVKEENGNSVAYSLSIGIIMKAISLFKYSSQTFGSKAASCCVYWNSKIENAIIVLGAYPEIEALATYSWHYQNKEEMKQEEIEIASPSPMYDTHYRLLIENPQAHSFHLQVSIRGEQEGKISIDSKGKGQLGIVGNDYSHNIQFNQWYFHYPVNQAAVFGFGLNKGKRMGTNGGKTLTEPARLSLNHTSKISIYACESHSIAADCKGNVYCAGKGNGALGGRNRKFEQYEDKELSSIIATNSTMSLTYDRSKDELYAVGRNNNGVLPFCEGSTKSMSGRLKDMSMSEAHAVLLYNEKDLYASPAGRKTMFGAWIEEEEKVFHRIPLEDHIAAIHQVLALNTCTVILCDSRETGKRQLYSYGSELSASRGIGDKPSVEQYQRLDYPEGIEFVYLTGRGKAAAAISNSGELYTWGEGSDGMLGVIEEEKGDLVDELKRPTRVASLEGYRVRSVGVGADHMIVLAESKESGGERVFGFGSNSLGQLGTEEESAHKTELIFFEGRSPYAVAAGQHCSFVCCGTFSKGIRHQDCRCEAHGKEVEDVLFLARTKTQGMKYWCTECAHQLPSVAIALRNPIKKTGFREWPILDSHEVKDHAGAEPICSQCKYPIKGAVYESAVTEVEARICESCFMKPATSFNICIYYRFSKASIQVPSLPKLSLSSFYTQSLPQVTLKLIPKYRFSVPPDMPTPPNAPSIQDLLRESNGWTHEQDIDLMEILNEVIEDENDLKHFVKEKKCEPPPTYKAKSSLAGVTRDAVQRRLRILCLLNKIVLRVLKYMNFKGGAREGESHVQGAEREQAEDLYSLYCKVKPLVISAVKRRFLLKLLQEIPKERGKAMVELDRHKAVALKSCKEVDHSGERSLFGQLWRQMKDKVEKFKKREKGNKGVFKVRYKGEEGEDVGGLFRDCIDQICEELNSQCLPLFVPSPNNQMDSGEDREKWIINPAATHPIHLEMYEFLGALIGMSFRTSCILPLNLSSLFWKRVLGDKLALSDLKSVDLVCVRFLEEIAHCATPEDIEEYVEIGREMKVQRGGRCMSLTFENRLEFVEEMTKARLEDGSLQLGAVMRGIEKVVPLWMTRVFSSKDLEEKICGKSTFKVEALKKITKYDDCSESTSFVRAFWQALQEFSDKDRSLYLRFVWGRSRLPPDYMKHQHRVQLMRRGTDETLPVAHTCFFLIELPAYSSVEIAKEKLRYAIRNCASIENYQFRAQARDSLNIPLDTKVIEGG